MLGVKGEELTRRRAIGRHKPHLRIWWPSKFGDHGPFSETFCSGSSCPPMGGLGEVLFTGRFLALSGAVALVEYG